MEGLPALPFWVSPGAICHLSCGVFWERPPLPVTCGGMTDEWGAGSTHAPHCLSGLPWLQGKPGSLHLEQRALGRIRFQHQESRGSSFSTVSVHLLSFFHTCQTPLSTGFPRKEYWSKRKKNRSKGGGEFDYKTTVLNFTCCCLQRQESPLISEEQMRASLTQWDFQNSSYSPKIPIWNLSQKVTKDKSLNSK